MNPIQTTPRQDPDVGEETGHHDPLDDLLTQIINGFFVLTDGHGVISKWSEPAELLFGLDASEVLGKRLFDTLVDHAPPEAEAWKRFLESGGSPRVAASQLVSAIYAVDQRSFSLEMVFIPVKCDDGFDFSLFLEDLSFELPRNLMLMRMRRQHPVVVRSLGQSLETESQAWDGGRTAGTLVAFRPTQPTPWVEEALAAREAARAEADAEAEERLDPDPGIQGDSISDLDDAAAVVARLLAALDRIEELEKTAADVPVALEEARREAQAGRDHAEQEVNETRAQLERIRDEMPPPEDPAERRELLERITRLEANLAEARPDALGKLADELRAETRQALEDRESTLEARVAHERQHGLAELVAVQAAPEQPAAADAAVRPLQENAASTEDVARAIQDQATVTDDALDAIRERAAFTDAAAEAARHHAALADEAVQAAREEAEAQASELREELDTARADLAALRQESSKILEEVAMSRRQAEAAMQRAEAGDQRIESLSSELTFALAAVDELKAGLTSAGETADIARREAESVKQSVAAESEKNSERVSEVFREIIGVAARSGGAGGGGGHVMRRAELGKLRAERDGDPAPIPTRAPRRGFDDVTQPLAVLNLKGRFCELNPAFSKLVGYREHEFMKAVWPSVHDRAVLAEQTDQLRAMAAGELEGIEIQSSYMHSQGLMVAVDGELTLVRDDNGEPMSLLLTTKER